MNQAGQLRYYLAIAIANRLKKSPVEAGIVIGRIQSNIARRAGAVR